MASFPTPKLFTSAFGFLKQDLQNWILLKYSIDPFVTFNPTYFRPTIVLKNMMAKVQEGG